MGEVVQATTRSRLTPASTSSRSQMCRPKPQPGCGERWPPVAVGMGRTGSREPAGTRVTQPRNTNECRYCDDGMGVSGAGAGADNGGWHALHQPRRCEQHRTLPKLIYGCAAVLDRRIVLGDPHGSHPPVPCLSCLANCRLQRSFLLCIVEAHGSAVTRPRETAPPGCRPRRQTGWR